MTIVYAATSDQVLVATILPTLARNNIDSVRLHVDFDSHWDGYESRSAVFTTSKSLKPYEVILSAAGDCLIPYEVLAEEAKLYITVKGVNSSSGAVKTSTELIVKVLGGTPAVIVSDPSPNVYEQLKAANALNGSRIDNFLKSGTSATSSELIDIRVGADGKTYVTAGAAVRTQLGGKMSYATNGYIYPPRSANIDIANNDDGSVTVTVFADSLTVITAGSTEYGGVPITATEIFSQLGSNARQGEDGSILYTVPSYNALCYNTESGILQVKSIRTISGADMVLIYNAWANACGGSFMDFYYRRQREANEDSHNDIIKFIGDQKTFVYIGSDGRVDIEANGATGWAYITLEKGISYTIPTGDISTTSTGISVDKIAEQLTPERAVIGEKGIVISLDSYQALCLSLETETLSFKHIRNIKPEDIVLLYNSWANVRGILLDKAIDFYVRDLKAQMNSLTFEVDTEDKCKEYAEKFNNSVETESFIYFTDPHLLQKGEDYETFLSRYIETLKRYYNRTATSFILCGGDWLGNSDTPTEAKYKLGYIDGVMSEVFDNYFSVLGNHDTNYQGVDDEGNSNAGILDNQTIANLWYRKYGKNYYAFDGANTRFYVLDTGTDWDYSLSKYRLSQVEWLGKMLKNEDKAHSAIAMHIYFSDTEYAKGTLAAEIALLLRAYHGRQVVTLNGVTYNFTGCTGRVEFIITGHTHLDMTDYIDTTPVICTTNTRNGETPTFDLVYADYDNRKIHLVRVGTGSSKVVGLAK